MRASSRSPSPSWALIVWGSGRLWWPRWGRAVSLVIVRIAPPRGALPARPPMIDILLLASAYLLPTACRYRLPTPFPCLILILLD